MNMHAQLAGAPPARWSDQPLIGCDELFKSAHRAREPEPALRRAERTSFEIHNGGGKLIRGVEIELAGFGENEVFRAYFINRHGTPGIVRAANSIRMRFVSLWRTAAQTLSQSTLAHDAAAQRSRPFTWEFALHGGGSSERFCLETSTREVIATYWWLVSADANGETLVAESAPAYVQDARSREARTGRTGQ